PCSPRSLCRHSSIRHPLPSPTRRSSDLVKVDQPPMFEKRSVKVGGASETGFLVDSKKKFQRPVYVRACHERSHEGHGYAVVSTEDRKSTRLNSSHVKISYAVFCLKTKNA